MHFHVETANGKKNRAIPGGNGEREKISGIEKFH